MPETPPPATAFQWPGERKAALSLTFDDARPSQVDRGIPLLDRFAFRASFYVSIANLQKRRDQWQAVAQSGHEIGGHSLRHACSGNFPFSRDRALEDYSLEQMERELIESNERIEDMLGVRPRTFAYPCGQTFVGRGEASRSYVPVVARLYLAGRCYYTESCNAPDFCDLARLFAYKLDTQPLDELIGLIEKAIEQRAWIVFAGHETGASGHQNIDLAKFRKLLQYLQNRQDELWTDTVESVAQYIQQRRRR